MKRRAGQILILSVVAVVATIVASWPSLLSFLVQEGLQAARRAGTNLSWNGLTTGISSVGFDSLSVWIPGPRVKGTFTIPVSIELQRPSVTLNPSSLLSLSPSVTYTTQLYGGTLFGDAQRINGLVQVTGNVENVEIGKHPQLSSLGVRGGVSNGAFNGIEITQRGVEGGEFFMRVRGLEPPTIQAAKTILRTDNFGTLDIDAEGAISPSKVDLANIRVSSIFGSVVGRLTVSEHLSPSPSYNGSWEVSLSETGGAAVGPWLQLLPNAGLDTTTTSFLITASSVSCATARSSGTILRLGGGCVKLIFTKR